MPCDRLADTLAHDALLRWPPARAAGWSCTSPTGRMRHPNFHTTGDTTRYFAMQTLVVTWWVVGIAGTHSAHAVEFWGRWTFASAAMMPAAFLAFAQVFPTREHALPRR